MIQDEVGSPDRLEELGCVELVPGVTTLARGFDAHDGERRIEAVHDGGHPAPLVGRPRRERFRGEITIQRPAESAPGGPDVFVVRLLETLLVRRWLQVVWHGGDDRVVKPELSRQMVDALKAAGGQPRYTEIEHVGHNSWDTAYATPDLYTWLFQQKKK